MRLRDLVLAAVLGAVASAVLSHDSQNHAAPKLQPLANAVTPFPWKLGGDFELLDHTGQVRTQADPQGHMQLVFFGYANCPGICSAALPMMADAADLLQGRGIPVSPILITIDPVLDTVETMGPSLEKISAGLIGLTGERAALNRAYQAFQIDFEKIMDDPEHGPIYAHGSHIFLLDGTGKVLTLVPPVLSPEQVADIVEKYADA